MQEALSALEDVLENERSIYGEMLLLAEQQREALINRKIDTLTEIAAHQEKMVMQADWISRKGRDAAIELSRQMGLENSEPVLSELLERLDEEQAAPLKALRKRIQQAAERLAQINRINAELFDNALSMIQFTMKLLAQSQQAPDPCYPLGENSRQTASILVDQLA